MSSAKTQIAVAPNVSTLAASQIQKEYSTDEPLNRQNSLGNNRRGNMKGKHLTRSHAMRESTSPPRTPTPRTDQQLSSPNGQPAANYNISQLHHQQHHDLNDNSNSSHNNNSKLHAQSSASAATSPLLETPSVIVTSQHSQQQQKQNVVICNEADFPKLTPPKSSKSPRNNNHSNNSSSSSSNNNNHRDVSDKSNSSSVGDSSNKMEYNNIGGCNGKKMIADNNNKSHANNSNSNNAHNNNSSNIGSGVGGGGNINKNQSYSSTTGANAMQMALNVSDTSSKQQQTTATSTTSTTTNIYNSSMNYQLKPDTGAMSQQHQSQQSCSSSSNMYDKENRCPRNDSQNSSNNSMSHDENQNNISDNMYDRGVGGGCVMNSSLGGGGGGGKKHRTTSNSKGTKPRLKNMGSSSSMDGGNSNSTSGFISRGMLNDSSMEQFTDQSGIDLLAFFKDTLNKNPKDRNTLMKIEKDLVELAQDKNRSEIRFPATSSYNRMLIHRTAAFFGMEHNVDAETQQCVIVGITKGSRMPEIRFKTLFRDRMSDEPRKSILKRDTHSFDDARQGSYLCPDRGMLDRKAKSFEEREEDYEKARRRIFRNQQQQQQQQQADNGDCDENYLSWSSSVEQQQQQQQHQQQQSRMRPSGKMLKVQTSNESRDGRPVGVSKANSFGSYGVPPPSGGPPLMRGDSNKSSGSRVFAKQDSMGSTSTPWRLSPSSSGSIYHFDPSNLPPSQAINSGMFNQSGATNHGSYSPQQANVKKPRQPQHKTSQIDYTASPTAACNKTCMETCSESSTQTVDVTAAQTDLRDTTPTPREMVNIQEEDSNASNDVEECDNTGASCLSVTTTTSTKSYDRIEIQKFKNQATSPNIPTSPAEIEEASALHDGSVNRDQPSRNQYQSQTPSSTIQQHRDTPNSARSTPYSNADSNTKRTNEESKASPWTYTQSYQAPDGSTVFHTNGSPYCTTTYQQGPDGSVYAIPQSMVYAYPPQMDGDVQGYFMPVFDPAHQRPEATGIIPAGTQAIYSTTGGATAVLPVATAYPSAQFATTAGTPIYPGQVLYSSEQFPASGGTVPGTATAANATGPLQQYPVTTYPIGYPYPYNGYWGQTMTTYYVPQQTLANAATATPLLPAPPPPAPTVGSSVAGSHLVSCVSGASLANNLMVASAAAGPTSTVLPNSNHNAANGSGSYQGSVIYNGTMAGRGKRTTPPHQSNGIVGGPNAQNASQNNHHHTVNASGITTTYQLGHAVPTFALATTANAPTASDLISGGGSGNARGTTAMYAIPQHATMFPANILPYAASASQATSSGMLAPVVPHHAHHAATSAITGAPAHSHQSNTVISPLFSHPPHVFAQSSGGTAHAPGPSAIAIVDPATVSHSAGSFGTQQQSSAANSGINTYIGNSTPQSAPSTPHSLTAQHHQHQRNPPLFATPPITTTSGGGVSYHYYAASNETPSYSTTNHSTHSYVPTSYEKRNNGASTGKKPTYSNNNISNSYTTAQRGQTYGSGPNKSLLSSSNEMRSSPSSGISISSNYQGNRPHAMNKRSNDKPASTSLLNGPPVPSYASTSNAGAHNNSPSSDQYSKNSRMNSLGGNSSGGSYRHKPSSFDFRRSASQRNSPSTNSSNESNNNSPSSIVSSPPSSSTYSTSYVTSAGIVSGDQQQQPASSLYIARGPHIPPTMAPHGATGVTASGAMAPPPGAHQATTAAVLGGAAAAAAVAEVANAAAAAAAVATGHQPLLGTYNPGAPTTGVYIKYGQTYFAHPTVALPSSRRSPQSDLRPPMAPMPGMYPAVNMMLSAPTRPLQQRHPNPNYKGTRPSR